MGNIAKSRELALFICAWRAAQLPWTEFECKANGSINPWSQVQPGDGAGQQWMRVAIHGLTGTLSNGGELGEHSCIPWQPGCWATTLAIRCWGLDAPAPLIGAMARGGLDGRARARGGGGGGGGDRVFSVCFWHAGPLRPLTVGCILNPLNLICEHFLTCGHCARFVMRVTMTMTIYVCKV